MRLVPPLINRLGSVNDRSRELGKNDRSTFVPAPSVIFPVQGAALDSPVRGRAKPPNSRLLRDRITRSSAAIKPTSNRILVASAGRKNSEKRNATPLKG